MSASARRIRGPPTFASWRRPTAISAQDVASGKFREDLLYRLTVIEIVLPPLRRRPRDVPALAEHLLRFFSAQAGKALTGFTEEVNLAFTRYPWPGNVRELRNAVERGIILTSGPSVGLSELPAQIGLVLRTQPQRADSSVELGGRTTLEALEAEHIRRILASTVTIEEASTVLGIDPSTLYRKRKRYGL